MKIVVIGGSGLIGRNVVRRLAAQGHDPVPASPATGVDTITGEGLSDVVVGADAVVDVSNAPVWDDDAVMKFFTTSSRNLLAAERDAGVGHHIAVSIVGADDVAATVAELAIGGPVGERVELGGPEALGIDAWARRLFGATGDKRAVIADPHAEYYGTELNGGELTPGAGARIGKVNFDTWFAANQQEAR